MCQSIYLAGCAGPGLLLISGVMGIGVGNDFLASNDTLRTAVCGCWLFCYRQFHTIILGAPDEVLMCRCIALHTDGQCGRRPKYKNVDRGSTSWACQVTAREVDWSCPAQCKVFGSDLVDTTIMHKSNKRLFFVRDIWPI